MKMIFNYDVRKRKVNFKREGRLSDVDGADQLEPQFAEARARD